MRNATLVCVAFAMTLGLGAIGCGGDDTSDGTAVCPTDSADKPAAAHFKADVLPILQRSCGLAMTCHGDSSSPTTALGYQPYLGPPMTVTPTDADIMQIFTVIKDKTSKAETDMKIVASGDAAKSFLMHKLDGLCSKSLTCGDKCGTSMPQSAGSLLSEAERDKFRGWIAAGANND